MPTKAGECAGILLREVRWPATSARLKRRRRYPLGGGRRQDERREPCPADSGTGSSGCSPRWLPSWAHTATGYQTGAHGEWAPAAPVRSSVLVRETPPSPRLRP